MIIVLKNERNHYSLSYTFGQSNRGVSEIIGYKPEFSHLRYLEWLEKTYTNRNKNESFIAATH